MTRKDDVDFDGVKVTLAAQLMKLNQNDRALKILNEVIATSPQYARAWSNRAVIRYQQGEGALARSDAEMALRVDSNNTQAQDLLGLLSNSNPVAHQP